MKTSEMSSPNDNLFEIIDNISALSPQEKNHFTNYLHLLEINRKKADDYVAQLLSIQQMDKELQLMLLMPALI